MSAIEINDAIHKTISLTDEERRVIDHPYMQRLRFVKQLGFVSFVYPAATHDRFSHSLGTLHVASRFARQLFYNEENSMLARLLNEDEKHFCSRMVRLAGLTHDVGHAPFSHAAESMMPPIEKLAIPSSWFLKPKEKRRASHEDYSVLLIAGMSEGKHAVLDKDEAQIIASLVHHKKIAIPKSWHLRFSKKINTESLHAVARSAVSSNIDADRMDYLLRDSYFTGVAYGHYDLNWLIANLGVVPHGNGYMMSISDSGIHALEHYLFARYHMYLQVYLHKTAKCFENYFQRALDEGEVTYAIPHERHAYAALRDSTLLEKLFEASEINPRSWSALLMHRRPSKRIARIWEDRKEAERIFKHIEKDLAPYGIQPFAYITELKFLDVPTVRQESQTGKQGQFLFGLSAMPMAIIHKQFGVVSSAPIADYSFILKQYHHSLVVGDIYIRPDELEKNQKTVLKIAKKYRTFTPSEVVLREGL